MCYFAFGNYTSDFTSPKISSIKTSFTCCTRKEGKSLII